MSMKRIISILGLICMTQLNGSAANYAVTFWSGDSSGIPDGWPQTVRELGDATGPLSDGESLKTREQLNAIKRALQPAMDSRHAGLQSAEMSLREARRIEIKDTLHDLRKAIGNWDALTSAQQKDVLKRVVSIVLVLVGERSELFETR